MGIGQKELTRALSEVLKASVPRPALPILAGVVLEVKGGYLSLTCTDLEQYLTVRRPASGLPEGKIVIKGKEALNILKTLPAGEIELEFEPGKESGFGAVHFKQGRIDSRIERECPNEDWPVMPELSEPVQFSVLVKDLIDGIEHTRAAVCEDDNRPDLNGIFFTVESGKLATVATNCNRLAVYRTESSVPEGINFILPVKTADMFPGLFKGDAGLTVNVYKNKPEKENPKPEDFFSEFVTFDTGEKTLTTRLVEGRFPDYHQVVPDITGFSAVNLPRKEVTVALKRIENLVIKGKNYVMLDIAGNILKLAGEFDKTTICETFDVAFPFPEVKTDFNPGYLIDGIKAVEGESFVLYLNPDPENPSVIKGVDGQGKYLYLVMPMRDVRPIVLTEEEKEALRLEEERDREESETWGQDELEQEQEVVTAGELIGQEEGRI